MAATPSCDPGENKRASAEAMVAAATRRPATTLHKAYRELVGDALRVGVQSGKVTLTPAHAIGRRLKHIKRVVDRQGIVRLYYVRGPKPHIRLDAPEGTPAFSAAYEVAKSAKALGWRLAGNPTPPLRSVCDLVHLYQRTQDYARLAPQTQRVYDRVLWRLVHVEGLGRCSVVSLSRQHIQQFVDRHADAPAAAADLLKKLRILFKCAVARGWRPDNPTHGVVIGRKADIARGNS